MSSESSQCRSVKQFKAVDEATRLSVYIPGDLENGCGGLDVGDGSAWGSSIRSRSEG